MRTEMKKILSIFILVFLVAANASADTKVIERSAKKAPAWLGGAPEGCIIVTSQGATLSEAQTKAQTEITERIIKAVASNVSLTQRNEAVETVTNNGVESSDTYSHSSVIRAANLPFVKGISLSKAADTYWVKLQDKKTKREYYEYSVKYPFTRLEQEMMTAEFEELDKSKEEELAALEAAVSEIAAFDDIKSNIAKLDALGEYFVDAPRLARVSSAKTRYKDLYSSIALTGAVVSEGTIKCALTLNGHKLSYYAAPKLKSNCASDLQFSNSEGEYTITYNSIDCLPEEQNSVSVSFRINGKTIQRDFIIGANGESDETSGIKVVPTGKIYLTADTISQENKTISGLDIRMTLDNITGQPFGLKSIELTIPGIATPVVFDDIDAVYSTKGKIQVKAHADGTLRLTGTKHSAAKFINGKINIVNPSTQSIQSIRLALTFSTNWE